MRFDDLTIEKYGAYSSKRLDLSGTSGLMVLYGPNEAGKSTTLSALVDLLYGIQPRSSRAQVFGGPAMSITAQLRLSDGSSLKLRRTKGNTRTLTDGSGVVLDDGTGAARCEQLGVVLSLFALNHESLRSGGEQLLDANGDIGRLIVEAGGGLLSLAAGVGGARRKGRCAGDTPEKVGQTKVLHRVRAILTDGESRLVTVDAYERVNKEAGAAAKQLENLRRQLLALRESHSSLERMAIVSTLLRQLERFNDSRTCYADLTAVATDFALQVKACSAARIEARKSLESISTNLEELTAKTDALQLSRRF